MFAFLFVAFAQLADPTPANIVAVRSDLEGFLGKHLTLCGEISSDRSVIFSDMSTGIHGRIGIRIDGFGASGPDKCILGQLVRQDGKGPPPPAGGQDIVITDSGVHPGYMLRAVEP